MNLCSWDLSHSKIWLKVKKSILVRDMLELGEHSEKLHRQIGEYLFKYLRESKLVTVGSEAKFIAEEAILHGFDPENINSYEEYSGFSVKLDDILSENNIAYFKAFQRSWAS